MNRDLIKNQFTDDGPRAKYIDKGKLEFDNCPGFCLVVNPKDLQSTIDIIDANPEGQKLANMESVERMVASVKNTRQVHEVYHLDCGEGRELLVVAPADFHDSHKHTLGVMERSGIKFIPANLFYERDEYSSIAALSGATVNGDVLCSSNTEEDIVSSAKTKNILFDDKCANNVSCLSL